MQLQMRRVLRMLRVTVRRKEAMGRLVLQRMVTVLRIAVVVVVVVVGMLVHRIGRGSPTGRQEAVV